MKEVDIIGLGLTATCYDWTKDTEKWSIGNAYNLYTDKIDLYFNMHPEQIIPKGDSVDLVNYPLEKITELTGSTFFTNSASYMIAYAYYKGYEKVNLYGIDMETGSEYGNQRPSVMFWIGYLKAKGVEVTNSSMIDEPPMLYGYDLKRGLKFIELLKARRDAYEQLALKEKNEVKKNQFIGAMHGTDKIINIIQW